MKILGLSSIRSDYDLMSSLFKRLSADPYFDFGLVVAGTHFSGLHKQSYANIEKDCIKMISRIENFQPGNTFSPQLKSAAKLLNELIDAIETFSPELILVAGDREDALMLAIAATYMRIPFIHFYGGDHAADGHVDNQVRHAISKLASFHFVCTEDHKNRLISLGENPERINVIGNMSIDNFVDEPHITRKELFKIIFDSKIQETDNLAFMLFHPIKDELGNFLSILDFLVSHTLERGYKLVIGKPNNDPGYVSILNALDKYANNSSVFILDSLKRNEFINLMRNISIMLGNSSSGILEMATLKKPVINLGLRQRGRHSSGNVIFSNFDKESIVESFNTVEGNEFKKNLLELTNPYGSGDSSMKAVLTIKNIDFSTFLRKPEDPLSTKTFYDR